MYWMLHWFWYVQTAGNVAGLLLLLKKTRTYDQSQKLMTFMVMFNFAIIIATVAVALIAVP